MAREAMAVTLFPQACRVCGIMVGSWDDGVACRDCWRHIETILERTDPCVKCGLRLPKLPRGNPPEGRRCGACETLAFVSARSCGPHEGALRESVLWLKKYPWISPGLQKLIERTCREIPAGGSLDSILPVPLHATRLAERSFNQAEVVARVVASLTGLPLDTLSLIRTKQTERHRLGMGAAERSRSLARAFAVRAPRLIADRRLLLVDDVLTTGCTADEIARTLLAHGAREIHLLTVSRKGLNRQERKGD